MKVKFDRVTINVRNLETAKQFFSELLETEFEDLPEEILSGTLKVEYSPPPDNFGKRRFAISPVGIELFETEPPVEKEGVRNVMWRVDNLEQAKEEMKRRGIRHLFDAKCGRWQEAIYSADDMYGVRWVLTEYEGDSVFEAMLKK